MKKLDKENPSFGQRRYIARLLGFDPEAPSEWPSETITHLYRVYHREGFERFEDELRKRGVVRDCRRRA